MKYEAILFDLDGTLLDTIGLYEEACLAAFRSSNLELSPEKFLELYHGGIHFEDHLAIDGQEGRVEEIRAARDKKYQELLRTKVEWYSDAKDAIESLPKHIPKAIVTGSWRSYINAIEERIPLSQYFDVIVTVDDFLSFGKPHPKGILLAVEKLMIDPKKSIYIGDQIFDVQTSHNAGMASAIVVRKYSPKNAGDGAEHTVQSLAELNLV